MIFVIVTLSWFQFIQAEPVDEETMLFLKSRAPGVLKLIERQKEEGGEELEEAQERGIELREIFHEEKKEHGEEWAGLLVGMENVEVEIEILVWRFEEEEIGEDEGENTLLRLLKKQIELQNKMDRMEMKFFPEAADEIEEELEWRLKNPEVALRERFEETLRDFGFVDEEDEEEEMEAEEISGPVYTPAPSGGTGKKDELHGITFNLKKDVLPMLETYCFDCHDSATAKGDIDLESALAQKPLVRNRLLWENVAERVKMGDMPPKKKSQPADSDRLKLRAWLAAEIGGFDYAKVRNPGYVPARRLTREEYNRTIRDLVGLDLRPADEFPMDFSGTSGFSNSANTLFLQTAHLDRYFTSAEGVIDEVRVDEKAWKKLLGNSRDAATAITEMMRRAYRRPPTHTETKEIIARYEAELEKKKSQDEALANAFKAILVSPNFLLRVENSVATAKDQEVSDFDLATRLSYFLWASTPDDELLDAAAAGKLSDSAGLEAQVERMLADPRSLSLGEIFAAEWLSTDDVGPRIRKDPIDNPWCTESLMAAMRAETAHFFHSLVMDNAPVVRLINADYTFLNAELARYYRIRGIEGDKMRRVSLETKQRGGIFGHASVLATTSFPDRTSPVVRGKWILDTLLGTPPPPPPPDVPEIDVEGRGRRAEMDPLGFALESYAEFCQWRGGIDDRGTLPSGAKFRGPAGLKLALIDERLDDLGAQVIRKMLAYALGRQLEFYDEATVREIAEKLKPTGYRFGDLVLAITASDPFRMKRLPPASVGKSNEE